MSAGQFIVGIDLGTTNCALAWVDPSKGERAPVIDLPIPQLVRPGEVASPSLLPSCVYLPGPHELPEGSLKLPWGESTRAVGELARWQGARVPGRLVVSAKSWLCHSGVDRQSPILPWGAAPEVEKVSPVEASALLLGHLAAAWNAAHPTAPLAEQEVVITVPASFDEVARALTVSAAKRAGLERFRLLEEPQAACYDFISRHRAELSRALSGLSLVLVVDVGGGTTDFTLLQVEAHPEGPALRRLAVGDHLMLGGDNMDATLARRVEEKLLAGGKKLPAAQWTQLVQATHGAKEALLGASPPERQSVALVASGSRLLGGAMSAELTREEVEALVVDGFFPASALGDAPQRTARLAIQELGLPYAQDPAVTRHLGAFLTTHADAGHAALGKPEAAGVPRPDAILLNGGVFNSPRLARALVEAVSAWWPSAPRIPLLAHDSLDLAVARGAAYYGLSRRGLGLRIGGGAARAYYIALAKDGARSPGVCLIPRGFEEGATVDLAERPFTLHLGRPVQFQLVSTSADRIDAPGAVVELDESCRPLPPIHTVLTSTERGAATTRVHLKASLTEIGTLELAAVSEALERWRLEFELRGSGSRSVITVTESMPARFAEAGELVTQVYGHKALPLGPRDVKNLVRSLERALGPRESWRVPVLRELWTALFAGAAKRRRSADHERIFFHLLGFSLRPGFGYPLDDWRAEQTFSLFKDGVQHHTEIAVWLEYWVLWRRVSGGLTRDAHRQLWAYLRPHLERRLTPPPPKPRERLKGVQPEGLDEMVRAAAALEHLPAADKTELGGWVLERLKDKRVVGGPWAWALGRLGSRVPLYGSGHLTVTPEVAEAWLTFLLDAGLERVDGAAFAAAQLARLTSDRTRDIEPGLRERTAQALTSAKVPESWCRMVTELVTLSAADEARALGDTLPTGLELA